MENRIQYVLLKKIALPIVSCCFALPVFGQNVDKPISGSSDSIDNEIFEIGVNAGIINIQDFSSEYSAGVSFSFKATEDFFLQFNYMQAEVATSSFEKKNGAYFSGDDRTYAHRDLLVGYNLFQGEFFYGSGNANLATFYLVGGVGDSQFGGEASFDYTLGAGYSIEFPHSFVVRVDYRRITYNSNLISADEEISVTNGLMTLGLGYLF